MSDLSRPGARLLQLDLPDGERVMVAEHLCGWTGAAEPAPGETLWPTVADAVRALTGRTRDGEAWISVLEEFAIGLAAPAGVPLPHAEQARVAALRRRAPGCHVDGPRAHNSGGWYMFVGGLPGEAWVMDYGDTPQGAARRALERAEALLDDAG